MGAGDTEEEDGPLETWTINELRAECKTLDLSAKGSKAMLVERIREAKTVVSEVAYEKAEEEPEKVEESQQEEQEQKQEEEELEKEEEPVAEETAEPGAVEE